MKYLLLGTYTNYIASKANPISYGILSLTIPFAPMGSYDYYDTKFYFIGTNMPKIPLIQSKRN
jgi:hypothetical protein